jgi:hypothetical protein
MYMHMYCTLVITAYVLSEQTEAEVVHVSMATRLASS